VSVQAIDEYGLRSEPPHTYSFDVALPKDDPVEIWVERIGGWSLALAGLYFIGLFPLLFLYPHAGWARSAVNSGVFTKFPVLHKIVLNSGWARRRIFRRWAEAAVAGARVPEHHIPQALFHAGGMPAAALQADGTAASLRQLFKSSRRALVLARSGTGKSVLLRFLLRETGTRFLKGEELRLPVLIDLRTSPIAGRDVKALIRDALRGGGAQPLKGRVELPDAILDHLIGQGGFILLIDSLNELADWKDAQAFHPFFNDDAANYAILASQVDLLGRPDLVVYRLAEVEAEQARAYLREVTGEDVWDRLPMEAKALARNPQDLELLAEVVQALGPERPVPSRRAELYREILAKDTALAEWAASGGPAIRAVYGLAMRMVQERLVVGEEQLRDWLRAELSSLDAFSDQAMADVVGAIGRSRLFREETEVGVLGKRSPVTGFRHELVGKFLASRHVREVLATPRDERRGAYLELSAQEEWLDLFYFIVDELDSKLSLNGFLKELLDRMRAPERILTESGEPFLTESGDFLMTEGDARLRIVAYALGTKAKDMILGEVRQAYNLARLGEDLRRTPAA
jgi:hypothetical protein